MLVLRGASDDERSYFSPDANGERQACWRHVPKTRYSLLRPRVASTVLPFFKRNE